MDKKLRFLHARRVVNLVLGIMKSVPRLTSVVAECSVAAPPFARRRVGCGRIWSRTVGTSPFLFGVIPPWPAAL